MEVLSLFGVEPGGSTSRSSDSSSALGRSVELMLAARLLQLGHKVAAPLVDDHTVDLIVNYRTTARSRGRAVGVCPRRGRTIKLREDWQRGPSTWLEAWHVFSDPGG